jgi:UDP-N-acetylglucosamine 2-epimerase (non-hydrolysing)
MAALDSVARELPVLFPVHPRTRSRLAELRLDTSRLRLVDPQPYNRFLGLEAEAAAVVTDSGGVQEETTVLGVPCFTLRDNTERPVTVTHGTNRVLGLDPARIADVPELLSRPRPSSMPPLWDGLAGARAADEIERFLGLGNAGVQLPATSARPA